MKILREWLDVLSQPRWSNSELSTLILAQVQENKALVDKLVKERGILIRALVNIRSGILPNGDHVDGTVSLYAEDVLKEIS